MSYILKKYAASFSLFIIIFALSVIDFSDVKIEQDIPMADKWVHFLMYGSFSFVLLHDMIKGNPQHRCPVRYPVESFIIATMTGILFELIQAYCTISRSGDVWDAVANSIGALMGCVLGYIVLPKMIRVFCKDNKKK